MTIGEVFFDEKENDYLWLKKIKEKLDNEEISLPEYRELLKLINRDKPEPLAMEHFYFPLGLWLAGLVISFSILLAEIIIKYRENQQ